MIFSEVLKELGIESYPEELETIYNTENCELDYTCTTIEKYDAEFKCIGERLAQIKECAAEVSKNPALKAYTGAAVKFLERSNHTHGFRLKLPELDAESPLYHYPIMLLAFALPNGIETYRKRGFPDDEIKSLVGGFRGRINSTDPNGKPNNSGYNWLRHYTSSALFGAGLFSVTPRLIDAPILVLKNGNGEYKIIMKEGKFHACGNYLGNAGLSDESGAFEATFTEDEEFYTGNEVIDSRVSPNVSRLSKKEWKIIAKQWDWMVGLHIPTKADLSEESMTKGFRDAMAKTMKHYADLKPRFVHTSTWLLSPKLAELQGEGSGIKRFSDRFIKYPIRSGGKELFPFAFRVEFESYEELPEKTSLQRKLKKLYLDGGFIHAHAGFVPHSDEWTE